MSELTPTPVTVQPALIADSELAVAPRYDRFPLPLPSYAQAYTSLEAKIEIDSILNARTNKIDYTSGQRAALSKAAAIIEAKKLHQNEPPALVISGYAGTGKTTIAENIFKAAQEAKLRIAMLAPTNRAIDVLRGKLDGLLNKDNSRTIYSALYGPPNEDGEFRIGDPLDLYTLGDIVVVDESSMITYESMQDLLYSARRSGAKLIFMGDDFQLEPVETEFDMIGRQTLLKAPHVKLTEVRRQSSDSAVLALATLTRLREEIIVPNRDMAEFQLLDKGREQIIDQFGQRYRDRSIKGDAVCVVATNKARVFFNRLIRQELHGNIAERLTLLENEPLISISNSKFHSNGSIFKIKSILKYNGYELAPIDRLESRPDQDSLKDAQRELYFRFTVIDDNDHEFDLLLFPKTLRSSIQNGDVPELRKYLPEPSKTEPNNAEDINLQLEPEQQKKSKHFEVDRDVVIATYGYAISAHKSQGGQWKSVFVLPGGGFARNPRWYYTAITRTSGELFIDTSGLNYAVSLSPSEILSEFDQACV